MVSFRAPAKAVFSGKAEWRQCQRLFSGRPIARAAVRLGRAERQLRRRTSLLAAVMPRPADLLADLLQASLHPGALIRCQSLALPVHATDPLPYAVQLTISPPSFAPVEAN